MQVEMPPNKKKPEEIDWADKLYRNKYKIAGGFVLFIFFAATVLKFSLREKAFVSDYYQASHYQSKLSNGDNVDDGQLFKIIGKYPELKPFFDHFLEQSLVLKGNVDEGVQIGQAVVDRLAFIDSPYREYSEASFLIEKGEYQEALTKALDLKEKLTLSEGLSHQRLTYFNLLRIGLLQKVLNGDQDEKEGWACLFTKLTDNDDKHWDAARNELITHLSEDQVNILDYLRRYQA